MLYDRFSQLRTILFFSTVVNKRKTFLTCARFSVMFVFVVWREAIFLSFFCSFVGWNFKISIFFLPVYEKRGEKQRRW